MSQPLLVDQIANALRKMNWNEQIAYSKRAEMICEAIGPAPAAALEMLDTLQELIEFLDDQADAEYFTERGAPVPNDAMRLLVKVRAAIAKAEGKL